jgi:hypothetical protein
MELICRVDALSIHLDNDNKDPFDYVQIGTQLREIEVSYNECKGGYS